ALANAADDLVNRVVLSAESASAAQRFLTARKAVKEGRLEEALAEYVGLDEEAGDRLVLLNALEMPGKPPPGPTPPMLSVPVRWLCQRDLAALPPEGLKLYRARKDGSALKWLDTAIAQRDPVLLRRIVDEAFASRAGDQAL